MTADLTVEELDRDGAIQEALEAVDGDSRAAFLRKAAVGGAALLGALAAPAPARTERGPALDTAILQYGLMFEYLQSTFYTEAERIGTIASMTPDQARWARVLGAHERAHVRILKRVLGKQAAEKPSFNFRGVTEDAGDFTRTAVAMEDLTVALLSGQLPRVSDRALRAAMFSLLTVEARHAAWARRIVGVQPVADAFDEPKTLGDVDRVVRSTRFIVARPTVTKKVSPLFTG